MTSPQRECFGPCDHPDGPRHDGRCRTLIVGPVVDHSRTRYFELGEGDKDYWRINDTAQFGAQVEYRDRDGNWHTSGLFTAEAFLFDINGSTWREITPEEVPNA